ncbi:MAG: hypothetical protein Q9160_005843 [Pyrenula sp. 1 TL-2023]
MDGHYDPSNNSKCKRRRLQNRSPLAGHLILDEKLRGDIGEVSEDLWTDLCGSAFDHKDGQSSSETPESHLPKGINYIAVAPWSPLAAVLGSPSWTILPVRLRSQTQGEPYSSLYFPPGSITVQSLLKQLENVDPARHVISLQKPIEIRLQAVRPLLLESIYVTVEKQLLENVDNLQSRFGGGYNKTGFGSQGLSGKGKLDKVDAGEEDETHIHDRLVSIVREALIKHDIVHAGDLLPLPLPPHPITHVQPPPAVVTACEPVSQGFVSSKTRIVLVQARASQERLVKQVQPARPVVNDVLQDTEDTSNEQFYSAAEDKVDESTSEVDGFPESDSEEDTSKSRSDDEESDDALEDMISLSAPGLPQSQSGTLSSITSATPRPGMRKGTGIQTPGSVFSNFLSMTSRPGRVSGKSFKAECLTQPIPTEALHPKPNDTDDDDAFIFVDTTALARIRCFSGDWVRLETAMEPSFSGISSLNFSALDGRLEQATTSRPARIFGLPGLGVTRPRYALDRPGERHPNISQVPQVSLTPSAFIPPILLENIGNPEFVKLSPWQSPTPQAPNRTNASHVNQSRSLSPPLAGEVMLLKLRTPMAVERTVDALTISNLRGHFNSKRRILKRGDLVGIPVDAEIGKATSTTSTKVDEKSDDGTTKAISHATDARPENIGIVWFSVRELASSRTQEVVDERVDESFWEGTFIFDPAMATLRTALAESRDQLNKVTPSADEIMAQWFGNRGRKMASQSQVSSLAPASVYITSTLQKRLSELFAAAVSPRATTFRLPPIFALLHSTQRQVGKSYTAKMACIEAGIRPYFVDCFDLVSEGLSGTSGEYRVDETLKQRSERILDCGPECNVLILQHIETLTADRILPALQEVLLRSRVLIATTTELEKISEAIRGLFSHEFEIRAPDETERECILRNAAMDQNIQLDPSVDLNSVALKTAALAAGDLVDVVKRASLARSLRLEQLAANQTSRLLPHETSLPVTVPDILISGGHFAHLILPTDFNTAIAAARSAFTSSIGAPKIPSVTWSDVGGLSSVKSSIMETISLPLERPELFANGMRKRSGILFYGPPGTGKTLLAKAIATEFSLNFFSVKGPELLNMYIGESEANVRRVFQRARDARPCVVFFDELDSVAPKRGNQGDSGGVMDRIVSQLLAELDGMSSSSSSSSGTSTTTSSTTTTGGVFVIGATNRPDLLDPALLRPGRFDKMVYLGVADTHAKQLTILQALTRKFSLSRTADLAKVADQLPYTYTGADLYALCSDAMLKAVMRKAREVDKMIEEVNKGRKGEGKETMSTAWFFDHVAGPDDVVVTVEENDFLEAKNELVASVSAQELAHFERIRRQFEAQDSSGSQTSPQRQRSLEQDLPTSLQQILPNSTSNPPTQVPLRPKPPPPKRSDTVIPAIKSSSSRELHQNTASAKGKAAQVANPDSGPEFDEANGNADKDESPSDSESENEDQPASHTNGSLDHQGLKGRAKPSTAFKQRLNGRKALKGKGKGKARAASSSEEDYREGDD